jgi:protease I
VTIVSLSSGEVQGVRDDLEKTIKIKVDRTMKEVGADEFDAVQLPGGAVNADRMRMVPEVQAFLRAIQDAGKPIAALCHAPWELVSAGLVRGRTLTSYHTIQDDVRNAGGNWVDRELVQDGNWVTSRQPSDLPAFNRGMTNLFSRARREARQTTCSGQGTTLEIAAESHRSVQGKATELHPFGAANREVPVIGQGPGTSTTVTAPQRSARCAITALTVPDAKIAAVHESALGPARTRRPLAR